MFHLHVKSLSWPISKLTSQQCEHQTAKDASAYQTPTNTSYKTPISFTTVYSSARVWSKHQKGKRRKLQRSTLATTIWALPSPTYLFSESDPYLIQATLYKQLQIRHRLWQGLILLQDIHTVWGTQYHTPQLSLIYLAIHISSAVPRSSPPLITCLRVLRSVEGSHLQPQLIQHLLYHWYENLLRESIAHYRSRYAILTRFTPKRIIRCLTDPKTKVFKQ